jgi:mannosidase alpha-like ER degradation enhancer 2
MQQYFLLNGVGHADMLDADRTTALHQAIPPLPESRRQANIDLIKQMFQHSYDAYIHHAFPAPQIKPLTCQPAPFDLVPLPGLTLIDALDTLLILKNDTEFARSVERLRDIPALFQNVNVSLFETNIRVLGGLLSAHQLATAFLTHATIPLNHVRNDKGAVMIGPVVEPEQNQSPQQNNKIPSMLTDPTCTAVPEQCFTQPPVCNTTLHTIHYWTYDGLLLRLAHDLGKRLLPAFATKTGIPYGTVNLVEGVPPEESKIASLAGAGTLSLEFTLLSRLTGDDSFGRAAKLATRALWMRRSNKQLLGKHVNIERGSWTEQLSGIGSNSDSFYEYLIKHYLLFPQDVDFWPMFLTTYHGVYNESRLGEWYADVDMNVGSTGAVRRIFESLMAFYPGMQVLLGELSPAARTLNGFFMVREAVGLLPERFNYAQWRVDGGNAGLHPLRPELVESCYFLHKATQGLSSGSSASTGWLWAADYALHTIHWHTWAKCGYSSVTGVSPQTTGGIPGKKDPGQAQPRAVNEMPSFFLSETLKYLYLAFDEDNIMHRDDEREWIFTTEAHPIHHVPLKTVGTAELRQQLLTHLRQSELHHHHHKESASMTDLRTEKWTERSKASDYKHQVIETEKIIAASRQLHGQNIRTGRELFRLGIIQPSFLQVETGDESEHGSSKQDSSNIAHLSLAPNGLSSMSMAIAKACPNLYSPSLSWINALSGGATDYSNVYVSSVIDEKPIDARYGVGLLSSSHALALYGTGLFLGRLTGDHFCPINQLKRDRHKSKTTSTVPSDTQRFDMGGALGAFDVSVYSEGNGFTIKQVNTGETIAVTVVEEDPNAIEKNTNEPYVMVYSTIPPSLKKRTLTKSASPTSSWLPGMNWKSIFTREVSSEDSENSFDESKTSRSVVIGDGSGSAFSCEVQVVERKVEDVRVLAPESYPLEIEEITVSFPCAPALFGPTMIDRLVKTNGLWYEGNLVPPDADDENGCAETGETFHEIDVNHPQIRLVRRGVCTFESKAFRMKERGAQGVVVINRDPRELFLMAHGAEQISDKDIPASVLVSGLDGYELLKLIEKRSPGEVTAKVVMVPRNIEVDENGNVHATQKLRFPVLQASPDAIQIFASGGWGVHAMNRPIEIAATSSLGELQPKREWQLYLLQHSEVKDRK